MGVMRDQTHANLLQRAGELVGGTAQLCKRLEVTKKDCERWLSGRAIPPQQVLLRIVNILVEHVSGKLPNQ